MEKGSICASPMSRRNASNRSFLFEVMHSNAGNDVVDSCKAWLCDLSLRESVLYASKRSCEDTDELSARESLIVSIVDSRYEVSWRGVDGWSLIYVLAPWVRVKRLARIKLTWNTSIMATLTGEEICGYP